MQLDHYSHRIFRTKLINLSSQKQNQALPRENSFFTKIRKNKAVICLREQRQKQNPHENNLNSHEKHHELSFHQQSYTDHIDHKQRQVNLTSREHENSGLKQKRTQSLLLPKLGKISRSKGKPSENEVNTIGATILGSQSTTYILEKRQQKIKQQERAKLMFLQNHIKYLKSTQHEDQNDSITQQKNNMSESFSMNSSIQLRVSVSCQKPSQNKIFQAQYKFKKLLNGQLSDNDYIEYNKKLLQKNVVKQRRYFQRYKNILQKQRAQIK